MRFEFTFKKASKNDQGFYQLGPGFEGGFGYGNEIPHPILPIFAKVTQ